MDFSSISAATRGVVGNQNCIAPWEPVTGSFLEGPHRLIDHEPSGLGYYDDALFRTRWFHLTDLVVLSMLTFLMCERFQALGKGHQHAFRDGVVWRRYEKQIIEFR